MCEKLTDNGREYQGYVDLNQACTHIEHLLNTGFSEWLREGREKANVVSKISHTFCKYCIFMCHSIFSYNTLCVANEVDEQFIIPGANEKR